MAKTLEEEKKRGDRLSEQNVKLLKSLDEEKLSVNSLRMEVAKLEIDFKSTKAQLDELKVNDAQKITRMEIDRDKEVLTIRETQDTELQRFQNDRKTMQDALSARTIELRKLQRELNEANSSLQNEKIRRQELEVEAKSLSERLEIEQTSKSSKLMDLLDVAYRGQEDGEIGSKMEEIRRELIATFQQKEKESVETIDKMTSEISRLTQANRTMYEKFSQMRYELEDNLPNSTILTELPKDKDLAARNETDVEAKLRVEFEALKRKLQERSSELSLQQEKNLQIGETYKKNVTDLEKKSSQLLSENAILKHERERLIKEAESSAISRGTADPATLRKMEELQSTLLNQMNELKSGTSIGASVNGISAEAQTRISQLENDNQKLKRVLSQNRRNSVKVEAPPLNNDKVIADLKEEISILRKNLSSALNGTFGEKDILVALEATERKCAQLSTEKMVLEEELTQYKTFMTKEISKYKAQIQKLKRGK
jgi:hypothetical protein